MKKIILLAIVFVVLLGCRSAFEKRIKKDITGINEQLYDFEREQSKLSQKFQELEKQQQQNQASKEIKPETEDDKGDLEGAYKDGYNSYLAKNYEEAIKQFEKLTGKYEENALTDDALYWQAEALFNLNRPADALKYYSLVYRYFPFSNKADYSLYKTGMIYFNQNEHAKSALAFERLLQEYPESDLYQAASLKVNQIKKNRRKK